jgi:hypothetical protein
MLRVQARDLGIKRPPPGGYSERRLIWALMMNDQSIQQK